MKIRICVLVLSCLALTACFGSGPAGTLKSFLRHLEAGELESAVGLLSKATRSQLPDEKWKAGLREATDEIQGKGGIEKIEIEKEDVVGETATVTAVVTFGDETEERDNHKLIQEKGRWRLEMVAQGK